MEKQGLGTSPAPKTLVGHKRPFIKGSFRAIRILPTTYAMDSRLKQLITEYIGSVSAAVALLEEAGIPRPTSDHAWIGNGISGTGSLRNGATYRKHGYGCEVHLASGSVDFDFGRAGQINGFDVWRLEDFAGNRLAAFGFSSQDELERVFKAEVDSGKISSSGHTRYYMAETIDADK
jgi:hypothetical protein